MGRYNQLFASLEQKNEGAFIPFVVLGDPDYETSLSIIDTLIESGADALELGIPFTDPLADGPEIQSAVLRAFKANITVDKCFQLLKTIREKYPEIPIGLLIYANLVHKKGIEHFYERCAAVGVDSVLIGDAPIREYEPFYNAAIKNKIAPVLICPPNVTDEGIENIAKYGRGYTYLVSRSGVTGMENRAEISLIQNINRLKRAGSPPIVQGFGIGTPAQAEQFIGSGVDGVISGSAIAKLIKTNHNNNVELIASLRSFIGSMKAATKKI